MWIRVLKARKDNPLFAQAWRQFRRGWMRSWPALGAAAIVILYSVLALLDFGVILGKSAADYGMLPHAIVRGFLAILAFLAPLFAYLSGAKSIHKEREANSLETLLLTDLTNLDLLAGKFLGTLLPFFFMALALLPAAIIYGGAAESLSSVNQGKLYLVARAILEFWRIPPWETVYYIFLGSVLGAAYGISRAARYHNAAMIYSAGPIAFLLGMLIGLSILARALLAFLAIAFNLTSMMTGVLPSWESLEPILGPLAMTLAVWALTLVPFYELAENFRSWCDEEPGERPRGFSGRRLSSSKRPAPWTSQRPASADMWKEWEERRKGPGIIVNEDNRAGGAGGTGRGRFVSGARPGVRTKKKDWE